MKTLAALLAATLALLLAACSTPSTYNSLKSTLPAPAAGHGRVLVYRDAVLNPKLAPTLLLNGTAVGTTPGLSFFYVDRPAGDCALAIDGGNEPPVTFALPAGQTVYVRINLHSTLNNNLTTNAQFYPGVVDAATAARELGYCRLNPPPAAGK